jgi:hypothetical protein
MQSSSKACPVDTLSLAGGPQLLPFVAPKFGEERTVKRKDHEQQANRPDALPREDGEPMPMPLLLRCMRIIFAPLHLRLLMTTETETALLGFPETCRTSLGEPASGAGPPGHLRSTLVISSRRRRERKVRA